MSAVLQSEASGETFQASLEFGATLREDGVVFRLWAPGAKQAELVEHLEHASAIHPSTSQPDGWFECSLPHGRAGMRYQWRIDGAVPVADPASRFNPEGPHGPSQVVDPCSFQWKPGWAGRPWSEVVLYELHIGTFTPQGTYAAAEEKLGALADLGVTAIELMPISTFPGGFGWGYDGVLPFAPYPAYGKPDELKHFIQAAHDHGLMVILDVVYNHFGPDGNYLNAYAPQFFSPVHESPWGDALNFDREGSGPVRMFFRQNALYWLDEYRFDGLRLDAVHAIKDDSRYDVIDEWARAVRTQFAGRHVHLILENQNNEAQRLPGDGPYDAQWNDDFHHVLYVVATGDTKGYYRDYANDPVTLLARCLARGFIWEGAKRGDSGARKELREPPAQDLSAMVNFLDNHDQSGNRAYGERFAQLVPSEVVPVAMALTLLSPATPMLFAGQEFAATTPFLYFADWEGELREQVVQGRAQEFAQFMDCAGGVAGEPPSPCDQTTFEACRLDWQVANGNKATQWRGFVRSLLALRAAWFTPRQAKLVRGAHAARMLGNGCFAVRWRYASGEVIQLEANMGGAPARPDSPLDAAWPALRDAREIFATRPFPEQEWPRWSARWSFGTILDPEARAPRLWGGAP